MRIKQRRNPWKGLFAGALGGFVGSFAMTRLHSLLLPGRETASNESKEDSTVQVASAISQGIFHRELTIEQKRMAGPAVHYAFGMMMGAAYGALIESNDFTHAGWGIPFGAAVWLGAHVIVVPALGFSQPVTQSDPASEAAEFGAHVAYGVVVEGLRRCLRTVT